MIQTTINGLGQLEIGNRIEKLNQTETTSHQGNIEWVSHES